MAGRQGELPVKDIMPISEVIDRVTEICKVNGVKRLELFGSFATGTAAPTRDIDFVVYGCRCFGQETSWRMTMTELLQQKNFRIS